MISQETKNKILDYARIEEVVGDFVNLKRAGANLKGNCPFHDEKSPSFVVSPAKNIYKCFGCGAAGDPLKFVMDHEHLSYPEALRYLANKYRIEVVEVENTHSQEAKEQQSMKDSLFIAMKYAAKYYQDALTETEEGRTIALPYFKHRGFTQKTIDDFQLGYAPDGFETFTKDALKSGYQLDVLVNAGLVKEREGKNPYDFFRARVMFPIHNLSGKVVAFGGRIMTKDPKQAKYINTAETDIYTKGHLVYGIYQAKNEIRKKDACYLVEGYTDVLGLYQSGISNVVASSGTALTKDQVRLIHRFTSNIILIYDGDKAGINAALRGVDIMLDEGMDVKVVILPDGEDPDSFVRTQGTDATLQYIQDKKKDFIFFKADILLKETNGDPTLKSNAIRSIVESISLIKDPIRRAYYTRECSKLAELPEEMLIKEVNKFTIQQHKQKQVMDEATAQVAQELLVDNVALSPAQKVPEKNPLTELYQQEFDVLRVLLTLGNRVLPNEGMTVTDYIKSQIGFVPFKNLIHQKLFDQYFQAYEQDATFEQLQSEHFYSDADIQKFLIDIKIPKYELSPNWETQHNIIVRGVEKVWENDVYSTINRYILHKINEQLREIDHQLKQLGSDDFEQQMALLEQKKYLQNPKIEIAQKFGTIIF